MMPVRVGNGYDVHRLVADRSVVFILTGTWVLTAILMPMCCYMPSATDYQVRQGQEISGNIFHPRMRT